MPNRPKFNYQRLFSTLPEGYIVFDVDDPKFTVLEENKMHAKLALVKRANIVGKPLLEAFPDTSDKFIETGESDLINSIRQVIKTKKPDIMPRLQYDVKDKKGNFVRKYWSVQHHPVLDSAGNVVHVYQATKEITQEVLASRRLREVERQLERALEVGKICTWSWDLTRDRVYGDQNLAYLFGCPEEEVREGLSIDTFMESIHPDDRAVIKQKITKTIKNDELYEHEYRTIGRDGTVRWVLARGRLERDEEGRAVNFPGAIVDITERKITEKNLNYLVRASTTLSESLDYKRTLQDVARLAVPEIADWCTVDIFDEKGKIQHVALAHKDPKKIAWAKELRKKQGEIDMNEPTGVAKVVRTGEPELYEYISDEVLEASAKDAEQLRLLRSIGMSAVMIVPLKVEGRTIGAMTLISAELKRHYTEQDLQVAQEVAARASTAIANAYAYDRSQKEIAVRAQLQEKLAQMNDRLEARVAARTRQLEKTNLDLQRSNRELENFAYVASHDLQEPLRKIQAFGNLLEEEFGEELGEGRDYLHRMRSAAERMSALINDLLGFSRVATKKQPIQEVDLNAVVEGVLGDLEDQIRRTNGIVTVSALPVITADETQMRQLFQNLIGNALKFHKKDTPPAVDVSARKISGIKDRYEITVSDNGVGFDVKYLDRIFAVFQRLNGRDEFEGTGIGLAVCRKIVERHGGTITAKSAPGDGATFIITLPELSHKKGEQL